MNEDRQPDLQKAAVCGLFCTACSVYIGTNHDPKRLGIIAKSMLMNAEDLLCHGCRSDTRNAYCRACTFVECAQQKGILFCGECAEYPCAALKEFQAAMPHRIELWEDQQRIQEIGANAWYEEKVRHYSCPSCQTINSAYDAQCYQCGAAPSNEYTRAHSGAVQTYLNNKK